MSEPASASATKPTTGEPAPQQSDVIVLGAGVIGVTTAYWLARLGHSVTVIERTRDCALETSFANGGQISVSHAEPWANPHAPLQALLWMMDPGAPLRFKLTNDPDQWRWMAQWLRECTPGRTKRNIRDIVSLALYSREQLAVLRDEEQLRYDQRQTGILHFYRSEKDFASARAAAALMTEVGCQRRPVNREEVFSLEPALRAGGQDIVGGTYTDADESGDVHLFTKALTQRCRQRGVRFLFDHTVQSLIVEGGRVTGVTAWESVDGYAKPRDYQTSTVVVAMGCWTTPFLKQHRIRSPIQPAKGYSLTLDVAPGHSAPTMALTDDANKLVYSRLGDRFRVAGAAELVGYDQSLDPQRIQSVFRTVRSTFPDAGDWREAEVWTGLRPATPSNRPIMGPATSLSRTAPQGLWVNSGHGTLGWTMACGSGRRIAEQISAGI